ncbi:MAG: XrtA/PEP-CTERM system TPR-repeat protein PrsT [Tistlia sp.]|uniref:XrtA/PEP-CTERM system TPR-repeat protein PrsT n=1 Tax=Tistlia sp. TaxID=3057121 RepID=UPI0034A426EE
MTTGTGLQHPCLQAPRSSRRRTKQAAAGLLAGLLLAAGAAGLPGIATAASPESQEFLDDAVERLEQGDGNAALIQLRNALQADPENLAARRLLGQLYLGAGHFEPAEKELARLLQAQPDDQEAALLLARARFGLRDYEGVLRGLPSQISDQELAYEAQMLRAEANLGLERPDVAAEIVEDLRGQRLTDVRVSVLGARTALARKQPEEAARFALEATEVAPDAPGAWLIRAQVALSQQRHDDAAEFAKRAEALAPGSTAPRLLFAEVALRQGRLQEAEETLAPLLAADPEAIEPRYLQAALLTARKDFAGAEQILDQLGDQLRNYAPAQFLTAMVKYQVGRHAQARTLVERYLGNDPNNIVAIRLLAATLLRSDQPERAVEVLTEARQRLPQDSGLLRLLATAQMRSGDSDAATVTLRELAQSPDPRLSAQARSLADVLDAGSGELEVEGQDLANELALILNDLQLGELEAAERGARALVEAHPDSPVAHNTLAGVFLVRGQSEAARAELEKALEIEPSFRAAHQNLDRLDLRAGDLEAIEERQKAYLERNPNDPLAVLHHAAFLAQRDRIEEARALVEQAIDAHPERRELLVAAITLAVRAEDRPAAEAAAERLAERLPDDPQGHLQAGRALLQAESFEAAAVRFERLRELSDGTSTQPIELLIQARIGAKDQAGAERAAEALVEARPENFLANRLLVDLYLNDGKEAALDPLLAAAAETDPELHARLRAHVAARKGEVAEAADILEQVAEPSPETVQERFIARFQAGDVQRAEELLRQWVAEHPQEAGPALLLANQLITREAYEEAEAILTAALPGAPDNVTLLNNLAWLRSTTGMAGAEELARRALGMAPDSPQVADTLGWILVQRGELEEGEALLRQAAGNAPADPAVAYHLAFALAKNGKTADALAVLEEIDTEEADFADAEAARELRSELENRPQ